MRSELYGKWGVPSASAETPEVAATLIEPTLHDLQTATADAYQLVADRLCALLKSDAGDAPTYESTTAYLRSQRMRLVRTRDNEAMQLWRRLAETLIAKNGWKLPRSSAEYQRFLNMIADAGIEALGGELKRREGDLSAEVTSKVVLSGMAAKANGAAAGETIGELFERYAAQRLAEKRKRIDTINQDRKVVQQFAQFVGVKRSLRTIEAADVRDWRDAIAALPPNYKKMKVYQLLPLREAAAKALNQKAKAISPSTINKYLSTVSPFIDWCRTNAFTNRNPCEGLFYDLRKGSNPRPPFSIEQLNSIFSSPLFTGFLDAGKEHKPGSILADDWRYWIPLLCLFSGARIGEIAQLGVNDIRKEHDVWFMHIVDDEAKGQQTKSRLSRAAPIHSKLQRLGFLAFVERQKERAGQGRNERLFPDLLPNERGQIGATPSRFWRTYLRRIGLKEAGDGTGSHSFRHTMADQLRLAGYLDDQIEVALGHNQKTVTSGYGRLRQGTVTMLRDMFEAVSFSEVDMAHLER